MKDREGRFLYVNQAVADFLGQSASALVGRQQADLLTPEVIDHIRALDEAAFISGQPQSREERLLGRSGEPRYFWTVKVPLMEPGQPERLIGLATDITELHRLREELERRATTDDLTGVANRGHFYTTADNTLKRGQRYGETLSLLVLDIDHFKAVNDTYGHQAGDAVLRGVAGHCRQAIRACDLIGRMGGEEFAILLPATGLEAACQLAERLRHGLQEQRWTCSQATDLLDDLVVTVSIGVAALDRATPSLDALYARADRALYTAKAEGRNRVSCG
jgi:diguanylate cyclase (GGDEF)-like protein/PAS domain S-box-containing protein